MSRLSQDVRRTVVKNNTMVLNRASYLQELIRKNKRKQEQINELKKKISENEDRLVLTRQQVVVLHQQHGKLDKTRSALSHDNLNNFYQLKQITDEIQKLYSELRRLQQLTEKSNAEYVILERKSGNMEQQVHLNNREIRELQQILNKQNMQNTYARNGCSRAEYHNQQLVRKQEVIRQVLSD